MSDLVQRIRARPNDAPMPTEHLLDEAADEIERLREVLKECTDELEGSVEAQYPPETRKYPSEARRYERDIGPVRRARDALK